MPPGVTVLIRPDSLANRKLSAPCAPNPTVGRGFVGCGCNRYAAISTAERHRRLAGVAGDLIHWGRNLPVARNQIKQLQVLPFIFHRLHPLHAAQPGLAQSGNVAVDLFQRLLHCRNGALLSVEQQLQLIKLGTRALQRVGFAVVALLRPLFAGRRAFA